MSPRFFHFIFTFLMVCYVAVGVVVHRDYGVPIDEYSQMDLGRVNYERIAHGSDEIQGHYDRHYGPAFEVPLHIMSTALADEIPEKVMAMRHLGIFLFFASSLICFYLLLSRVNGHPIYGLLGVLLLAVYPRFFAESFYNTKDVAFVAVTIFVLFALSRVNFHSWLSVVFLSAVSAFAIAVRAQGLLLLLVISSVLFSATKTSVMRKVVVAAAYIATTAIMTVIMFPLFWNNFFQNLIDFWRVSSNSAGVATYYFGKFYISPELPWHYHFVWVGISAMLSVLIGSVVGMVLFAAQLIRDKDAGSQKNRVYLGMLGIVVGTFLTSVFFHPRSYDGWRHIYYIYPCFVGFVVFALGRALASPKKSFLHGFGLVLGAVLLLDTFFSLRFLLKNHPNQYVYFNVLAGDYSHAQKNFDFDYWGISQKQIAAFLLNYRFAGSPAVYFQQVLPYTERVMIPELTRKGMRVAQSIEEADIYVTINRDFKDPPPLSFKKLYAVTVGNADLSAIYVRFKKTEK